MIPKPQEMARSRAPGYKHPRRSTDSENEADSNEVRLRSSEGEIIVVPKEAACRSSKVKSMIDENKNQPFWFTDISSNNLKNIIEFCKLAQDDTSHEAHTEFLSKFDDETLFNTMLTANDLEVDSLLELTVHANPIYKHTQTDIQHKRTLSAPQQKRAVIRGLKAKTEEELEAWLHKVFIDDADVHGC